MVGGKSDSTLLKNTYPSSPGAPFSLGCREFPFCLPVEAKRPFLFGSCRGVHVRPLCCRLLAPVGSAAVLLLSPPPHRSHGRAFCNRRRLLVSRSQCVCVCVCACIVIVIVHHRLIGQCFGVVIFPLKEELSIYSSSFENARRFLLFSRLDYRRRLLRVFRLLLDYGVVCLNLRLSSGFLVRVVDPCACLLGSL